MRADIARRVLEEAKYILETGATVRRCAAQYGMSKTTIHKDMRVRLPEIDGSLASSVEKVLEKNREERHLRGGMATQSKYAKQRAALADGPKIL